MIELYEKDIKEEISVCPYCGNENRGQLSCCGENHWTDAIVTWDGDIHLEDEYIVVDEPLTTQDKEDIKGDLIYNIQEDK